MVTIADDSHDPRVFHVCVSLFSRPFLSLFPKQLLLGIGLSFSCKNMLSSRFTVIFAIFFSPFTDALSSQNETIDASTCVAPKEYQNCYDLAVSTSATCVEDAGTPTQVLGCGCADYLEKINCVITACWNRVRTVPRNFKCYIWLILGDRSTAASIKFW